MKLAPSVFFVIFVTGCASTPEQKAGWRATSDVFNVLAIALGGPGRQPEAPSYQAPPYDYSYAWDLVYLQYNQPVWHCRGIQTGQYAHESKCAYKAKNDSQWPN